MSILLVPLHHAFQLLAKLSLASQERRIPMENAFAGDFTP